MALHHSTSTATQPIYFGIGRGRLNAVHNLNAECPGGSLPDYNEHNQGISERPHCEESSLASQQITAMALCNMENKKEGQAQVSMLLLQQQQEQQRLQLHHYQQQQQQELRQVHLQHIVQLLQESEDYCHLPPVELYEAATKIHLKNLSYQTQQETLTSNAALFSQAEFEYVCNNPVNNIEQRSQRGPLTQQVEAKTVTAGLALQAAAQVLGSMPLSTVDSTHIYDEANGPAQTRPHQEPQTKRAGRVLFASNLNKEKVTPDVLFALFGVYGVVLRVKILFKSNSALVQFYDPEQAETAMKHLNGVILRGRQIGVACSKFTSILLSQFEDGLSKDYTQSLLHRFKKSQPIYPPSAALHLSKIPTSTTGNQLVKKFEQFGTVEGFKFTQNDHNKALIQMSTVEEAIEALITLHSLELHVSFITTVV